MKTAAPHALYRGFVRHRRYSPTTHEFRYRISLLLLDLDRVDELFRPFPLLGTGYPALGWFRRRDYAGPDDRPLVEFVRDQVASEMGFRPEGKVLLLTHARYWGFVMNPISVFYCFDSEDRLAAVVLQVTNTPWREKVLYCLPVQRDRKNQHCRFDKRMHVSPFNPMAMTYDCRFQPPGRNLVLHLENRLGANTETDATLVLERHPLSRSSLIGVVLLRPATTVKVALGIYWNALRLWWKGTPVHDHPGQQKALAHPSTHDYKTT